MYTPIEKSFALTPAGNHLAICYAFIDNGTQDSIYGRKRRVTIRWELPNELMDDGRPFSIAKGFNWSMNKAATFRHFLESWRGRPFTADELNGNQPFDTKNLLGKACMLQVQHKPGTDGEPRAVVESVSSLPKGVKMDIPKQTNPNVYLALAPERWDIATFKSLSEKMQEIIASSPEYKALVNGGGHKEDVAHHDNDLDDAVPF